MLALMERLGHAGCVTTFSGMNANGMWVVRIEWGAISVVGDGADYSLAILDAMARITEQSLSRLADENDQVAELENEVNDLRDQLETARDI